MSIYDGFNDYKDMVSKFEAANDPELCKEDEVLCAFYDGPGYDGNAFVLFQKDGQLFEVNASHCSCYGLEDGWDPEPTTWAALKMRKFMSNSDALMWIKNNCPDSMNN